MRIREDCVDTGVKSQLGKQVPQRIHTLVLLIPGRDATLAKGGTRRPENIDLPRLQTRRAQRYADFSKSVANRF